MAFLSIDDFGSCCVSGHLPCIFIVFLNIMRPDYFVAAQAGRRAELSIRLELCMYPPLSTGRHIWVIWGLPPPTVPHTHRDLRPSRTLAAQLYGVPCDWLILHLTPHVITIVLLLGSSGMISSYAFTSSADSFIAFAGMTSQKQLSFPLAAWV
jgi:hypothetical protein